MVTSVRVGQEGMRDFDLLISKSRIEVAPVIAKQAEIARRAFIQYGKGKHPARLNFGDCLAYALASDSGEPLLFKGEDFGKTDIKAAPY